MINPNLLLYGSEEPLPQWISLRAGPLSMSFDPENLSLRYIRLGSDEVLRAIYAAVRDRNWGTVPPQARNLHVSSDPDGFAISFDACCIQGEIDFIWHGTLVGRPDGSVHFAFDGEARSCFLRNRIGICVLHPIRECAGQWCEVEHAAGDIEQSRFPRLISPHQPFRDVRALSHTIARGIKATVRFEGDVFETEDQRNWTDASFKTYSTPLDLPFPVAVLPASRVRQKVTLSLSGGLAGSAAAEMSEAKIHIDWSRALPFPSLGLVRSPRQEPLGEPEVDRLCALQLGHLRIEVRFSDPAWKTELRIAMGEAMRVGASVQLALHLGAHAEAEVAALLQAVSAVQLRVSLWLVHEAGRKVTPAPLVALAQRLLAAYDPGIPVAAGTDAYFAEWNRNRPPVNLRALPCYSLNPQVHAFDLATLVENLGGQADTVLTAFESTGLPVAVGPITLKPRFNPDATAATHEETPDALLFPVDPRQGSLFGAAWTLGSIAALGGTGRVQSLTFYELTGRLGIMETAKRSAVRDCFPSVPGGVFPVYHVFADLAGSKDMVPLPAPHGRPIAGLGCTSPLRKRRLLLANLSRDTCSLRVALGWPSAQIRTLDSDNLERAMREPEWFQGLSGTSAPLAEGWLDLSLPPFAIARADELL